MVESLIGKGEDVDRPTLVAALLGGIASVIVSLVEKVPYITAVARSVVGVIFSALITPVICERYGASGSVRDLIAGGFTIIGHYLVVALFHLGQAIERRSKTMADEAVVLGWNFLRRRIGGKTKDEPAKEEQSNG